MRILIYGDSNSWGYLDDGSGQRFGGRWPLQMASQLDAEIIEECLPGRVTHGADPAEGPQFDGTAPFLAILMSHQPLDRVIIMLGTNDMKARFDRSAEDISAGVMQPGRYRWSKRRRTWWLGRGGSAACYCDLSPYAWQVRRR